MSVFQPGDKVKFLNTSGGGVVIKIIDSRTVSVMIDEGFEIPTLTSDLISVNSKEPAARFFEEKTGVSVPAGIPQDDAEKDDGEESIPAHLVRSRKSETLSIAFVPHDQKWFITGPLDVILVNSSRYDVLYSIFSKTATGHFRGLDYGNIFPDSKRLITTINREQLTHWTEGSMQFLFHAEQLNVVPPPFNSEFRMEGKRFFKEGNYRDYPVVKARAVVMPVLVLSDYFRPECDPVKKESPADTGSVIRRHRTQPGEAVIDLHIHELVEDPSNLEGSDILDFQKKYFLKCLDAAFLENYRRLVFIHGIGNGILRTHLTDLLKKQEGIEFFDAPLSEYGAGAIEVQIHRGRD